MDSQLVPINYDMVQVGNVTNLSNFLSDISTEAPKLSISILPNIIKDFASITLENKKIKLADKQFKEKCKIINRCLDIQDTQIQNQYNATLTETRSRTVAELTKIQTDKEISIAKIESETASILRSIQSSEKTKNSELKQSYNIAISNLKASMDVVKLKLSEDARKFDKKINLINNQMKEKQKLRDEINEVCRHVKTKILTDNATQFEINNYNLLISLQVKTFDGNFDLYNSIFQIFSEV